MDNENIELHENIWHKVKVLLVEGTECGIVKNSDGELVLTFRKKGEDWPHNVAPTMGEMTVQEGYTSYVVLNEKSV
jgi:hypothetical protein